MKHNLKVGMKFRCNSNGREMELLAVACGTAILKDLDSGTVTHYDFELLKRSEIEILECNNVN